MLKHLVHLFFLVSLGTLRVGGAEKPNVLFLAVDDMNDWIGCLETTPHAITPNIDRLAARGVNFTNGQTAGVFCAPAERRSSQAKTLRRPAATKLRITSSTTQRLKHW